MIYKKKLLKYKGGLYTAEFKNIFTGKKHLRYYRHAGYRYDETLPFCHFITYPSGIYVYREDGKGNNLNKRYNALAKHYDWLNQQVHEGDYEHIPDPWIKTSFLDNKTFDELFKQYDTNES